MVFAVWAVRRDFAAAHPGAGQGRARGVPAPPASCAWRELDEVADAAARWEPFDAATLATYFRALDFSLGERQVAGLREFAAPGRRRRRGPAAARRRPGLLQPVTARLRAECCWLPGTRLDDAAPGSSRRLLRDRLWQVSAVWAKSAFQLLWLG